MPVNSSSTPALIVARKVKRRRRAEGGGVEDWRDREAQEALAAQQQDAPAPSMWERVKGVGASAADMAKRFSQYDRQMTEDILSAPQRIYQNPGAFTHGVRNLLGLNEGEERTQLWPEKMVRSGFTLPRDVMTGQVPQFDPRTGHTSMPMIERAQDLAGMAGGQTLLTGAADRAPMAARAATAAADSAAPGAPLAALERAPKFYSGLDRAVEGIPQPTMTGQQWLGTLSNRGVKAEEMQWSGLGDYLAAKADQPVTKAEVAQHLGANKLELGEKVSHTPHPRIAEMMELDAAARRAEAAGDMEQVRALREQIKAIPPTGNFNPRYKNYQLPGGENYREKLLTLPTRSGKEGNDVAAFARSMRERYGERWIGRMTPEESARYDHLIDLQDKSPNQPELQNYKSSHWDEPNVLAHRRTNEREVNGKRSLHVEEIQSDWHQAGRKHGYKLNERERARWEALKNKPDKDLTPQDLKDIEAFGGDRTLNSAAVPDAPFKKNWHELVLKDALREAAESGLDRISWTPGEAQAARYDLSKQVEAIRANKNPDGTYMIGTKMPGHNMTRPTPEMSAVPANKLADVVGKELAEKIIKGEGGEADQYGRVYSGLDLKVGGEGMKGFYDKIIPDALNKMGKKYGVKVEKGNLPGDANGPYKIRQASDGGGGVEIVDKNGGVVNYAPSRKTAQEWIDEQGGHPVHYMDIPPAMRDDILQKGFSLFEDSAGAGAPLAALEKTPIDWTPGGGMKTVKLGNTEVDYGVARDGKSAEIILTKTPRALRGQGAARTAMERMIGEADENGMTLFLNSDPMDKGISKPKLDRFYESLGFVKNKGRNKDFTSRAEYVRQPKSKSDSSDVGAPISGLAKQSKEDSDLVAALLAEQESSKKAKKSVVRLPERKEGGSVTETAMEVARRIKRRKGGRVHVGPISGDTGGRADKVPMSVPDGAYVIPADIVSGLGEGNTGAGMKHLSAMFPESKPSLMREMKGKPIPILAADGEFVISPNSITQRWNDLESGHKYLDAWVLHERQNLIDTLSNLDPPAQD